MKNKHLFDLLCIFCTAWSFQNSLFLHSPQILSLTLEDGIIWPSCPLLAQKNRPFGQAEVPGKFKNSQIQLKLENTRFIASIRTIAVIIVDLGVQNCPRSIQTLEIPVYVPVQWRFWKYIYFWEFSRKSHVCTGLLSECWKFWCRLRKLLEM